MNLFRIKNIRKYLTKDVCIMRMLGLVIVHLDYANGLYIGLPKIYIPRLQRIQNMTAKIVLCRTKRDSATQLPVHSRSEYKMIVTVLNA